MDGFNFAHHASPAHHHHQHHHQPQAHHHQQTHQHQHAGHHDPATAAAALGTSAAAHAHGHQHAHQGHAATSTPTAGTHHATYGHGATYEDLIAARTQLTDAVNRLSQAYRTSYEASDYFGRVVNRASNQALAQFFSSSQNASPFMSGDFNMFFSGLDTHAAGGGLGSLQSSIVGTTPQAGAAAIQTSYASLAQGNNTTQQATQSATGTGAGGLAGSATLGGATQNTATVGAGSTNAVAGGGGAAGEKKGRRSNKGKKERDPNAPKRPPSAYILFQNDVRDTTRREVPDMSYAGVLGKISTMWKALSDEERNAYTERRKKLMSEYSVLKKQYHARIAAAGGVIKDESDSDEEEEEETPSQSINPAAAFGNGTPNRHFTGAVGGNGLTSPASVDPANLKKRKVPTPKDPAVGKRTKH
ncbi:hypothetical protein OC835_000053 [Tilletia horrida]|nr:hypothetical protein OC835_000053 [Tilletia horrida]KAK0562706.1 hypothetical protein OC844_002561 [Tilletia horrida]